MEEIDSIDPMAKKGRPPFEDRTEVKDKSVTLQMTSVMHQALEVAAYQASAPGDAVSVAAVIRQACGDFLRKRGVDPGP